MLESSTTFTTAFKLFTLGYSVLPSGGGDKGKHPLVPWTEYQERQATEDELSEWQDRFSPQLWGVATGPVSGVFVIDVDTSRVRAELESEGLEAHVSTPRGGAHFYFRYPGFPVKTKARLLPGVDVRGDGGFCNIVGNKYEILRLPTPDNLYPWDQLPKYIQKAMNDAKSASQVTVDRGGLIPEGQRNATLTSIAGTMQRRGISESAITAALLTENKERCDPPLADDEVLGIAKSVSRYEPQAEAQPLPSVFNLSDMGNAERLSEQYRSNIRYCYECKRWLVWNGKVWEWDSGDKMTALAKRAIRSIYSEASREGDESKRKKIADHALKSESDYRIIAMLNLTQSEPSIPVEVSELDSEPYLLNCENGTVELHTGKLRAHSKEDLNTILIPTEYNPDAQCQRWLEFLSQVTGGDKELQGYLQRAVGYSLTGDTKSQVLFFLYGLGNNGKSTFITTIRKLLAEYAGRANTDLFMLKDKGMGGHREGLANLRGKRFISASELEEGRRLAVSLVKDMTGGETIRADRKYEHEVEYLPTYKIWLVGNHKPVVSDTTLSIWRRVKLIPFTVTIADNEIDPDLPAELEAELSGILTWSVNGCLDWQRDGLNEVSAVTTATRDYRHEQDLLGDFIDDCCAIKPGGVVGKKELQEAYTTWCEASSIESIGLKKFRAHLIEKGVTETKRINKRYWQGICLRDVASDGENQG